MNTSPRHATHEHCTTQGGWGSNHHFDFRRRQVVFALDLTLLGLRLFAHTDLAALFVFGVFVIGHVNDGERNPIGIKFHHDRFLAFAQTPGTRKDAIDNNHNNRNNGEKRNRLITHIRNWELGHTERTSGTCAFGRREWGATADNV